MSWRRRCAATGQAEATGSHARDSTPPIVNLFLAQLSTTVEPDVQAVLVWTARGFPSGRTS